MKRVMVVTGASSGIGRATAVALARSGYAVFAVGGRNQAGLETTLAEMVTPDSTGCLCDLRDPVAVQELIVSISRWAEDVGGRLFGLINLAGADVLTGSAADASFDEKLEALWEVDVQATIRLSRAFSEQMRAGGGQIITVGWDQAEWGMEGDSGELFTTVKAAVMAFSRSLAKSLAPSVRVNCVAPGWIKTAWGNAASPAWQKRAVGESLMGRWGTPQDVAQTICFLCSDQAAFINGQVIHVNGGFRRMPEATP